MKINYSEEDKQMLHKILDHIIEDGEECGVLRNAHLDWSNPNNPIKIKQYRVYIKVNDEERI